MTPTPFDRHRQRRALDPADSGRCRRRLETPPVEQLAFYTGVGLMAAADIIEWPVALVLTGRVPGRQQPGVFWRRCAASAGYRGGIRPAGGGRCAVLGRRIVRSCRLRHCADSPEPGIGADGAGQSAGVAYLG